MDTKELSDSIAILKSQAEVFFETAKSNCDEVDSDSWLSRNTGINAYWDKISQETRHSSQIAQESLVNAISLILPTLKSSPVLDESDEKDIGRCLKEKFRGHDTYLSSTLLIKYCVPRITH